MTVPIISFGETHYFGSDYSVKMFDGFIEHCAAYWDTRRVDRRFPEIDILTVIEGKFENSSGVPFIRSKRKSKENGSILVRVVVPFTYWISSDRLKNDHLDGVSKIYTSVANIISEEFTMELMESKREIIDGFVVHMSEFENTLYSEDEWDRAFLISKRRGFI